MREEHEAWWYEDPSYADRLNEAEYDRLLKEYKEWLGKSYEWPEWRGWADTI